MRRAKIAFLINLLAVSLWGSSAPAAPAAKARPSAIACARLAELDDDVRKTGVDFADLDGEKAEAACRKALTEEPGNPQMMANLARALAKLGRHDEKVALARVAAAAGNPQAVNTLAAAYEEGEGVEKDPAKAFALVSEAERLRAPYLLSRLAEYYLEGTGVASDPKRARALFLAAAELGYAGAADRMGRFYRDGDHGAKVDGALALRWFKRAVALGHADAADSLGYLYRDGMAGVPRDLKSARSWYQTAYRMGNVDSLLGLAWLLKDDLDNDDDPAEARRLYAKAAAEGSTEGALRLAKWMYSGDGAPRDYAGARQYFEKAAEAGNGEAYSYLGQMTYKGEGVPMDRQAARALFRKAGEAGDGYGWYRLGNSARMGEEGVMDFVQALDFYKKGAELGDFNSLKAAADILVLGVEGVAVDYPEATKWLDRAAEAAESSDQVIQVASYFADGEKMPADHERALRLYRKALAMDDRGAEQPMAELLLRRDATPSERREGMALLLQAADRGAGWAMAALAHPGPLLEAEKAQIDSARWTRQIAGEKRVDTLLDVGRALQRGRLSQQSFGLALQYAAAGRDPLAAKKFELRLLVDLKLFQAALIHLDQFVATEDFRKLSEPQRTDLFDTLGIYYSAYPKDAKDRPMLTRLAAAGLRPAVYALANTALEPGTRNGADVTLLRSQLEAAANRGEGPALYQFGRSLYFGWDGSADIPRALTLWERAYNAGETFAGLMLAKHYLAELPSPPNVPRPNDPGKALEWAQKGGAISSIARLHLANMGASYDPAKGIKLLKEAIHCRENEGLIYMGEAYLAGAGVPKNPSRARRWFELAATLGESDGDAAAWMVRANVNGIGAKPDLAGARRWFAEALRRDSDTVGQWKDKCGEQPTLACLRKIAGFMPAPIGPMTPGVQETSPAVEEADLQGNLARNLQLQAGSAIDESYNRLALFYFAQDRKDDYLRTITEKQFSYEARLIGTFGTRDNFFALISASCGWSHAAERAKALGMTRAALFFAKQAVNRLQDARRRIADLDPAIRECFIKATQDRYRYLANLFLDLGNFSEAEQVLAMLKDFESFNYVRAAERTAFDHMPMSTAEQDATRVGDDATLALVQAGQVRTRLVALQQQGELTAAQQAELDTALTALNAATRSFQLATTELVGKLAAMDTPDGAATRVATVQPRIMRLVKSMGSDVAVVHAVALPDKIHWLVTTQNWQRAIATPVDITSARKAIGAFRREILSRDPDAERRARELYEMIFRDVDRALRSAGVHHVMLSLDDSLRYVPFSALNDGRQWLAERYAFSTFTTLDEIKPRDEVTGSWRIAGFGASKGGRGMSPLPAVAGELASIVRDDSASGPVPGIRRLDEAFSRTELQRAMGGGFSIIHVASHFALNPDSAANSFLLLGDGGNLPLTDFATAGAAYDVDLFTLSACSTAVPQSGSGGSEIESSLGEIARNAGASSVMASLWSVSDASTADLMRLFYQQIATGKTDKSESLRLAQLALMKAKPGSKDYSHPFYWAPFILIGSWR